jgi:hypothetical protein
MDWEKQSINPSCPPGDVGVGIISSLDSNQQKMTRGGYNLAALSTGLSSDFVSALGQNAALQAGGRLLNYSGRIFFSGRCITAFALASRLPGNYHSPLLMVRSPAERNIIIPSTGFTQFNNLTRNTYALISGEYV